MNFKERMKQFHQKKEFALGMGGPDKLAAKQAAGELNARERIDYLLDKGTFREIGLFAHSDQPAKEDRSPCDGKVAGFGQIQGRPAAAVSLDITVLGASSANTNAKKMGYIKRISCSRGMPVVFLSEAGGARMPDYMGARGMVAMGQDPTQYQRLREAPWVSCLMGPCYGSPTWYSSMSDFTVMRKGAVMAVSSPKVTSLATGEDTPGEEMGGWRIHNEITGLVDIIAETDQEAIDIAKKFLSYLPSNSAQAPPTAPVPPGSGDKMPKILNYLPEGPKQAYDMRKLMRCIADGGEIFEIKAGFGRSAVTALTRVGGSTVGMIGNNTIHLGGALDADACEKITSFLVLCDSYNIPIFMLVDTPGFLVGKAGERRKVTGKIINFMNALTLVTVPKITVIVRKTYGQAFLNMGGSRNSDTIVAWPSAEISFMAPETGTNVVYNLKKEDDPGLFAEKMAILDKDTAPWSAAGIFNVNDVIDPAATRDWLISMLEYHYNYRTGGIGQHLMHNWPTSY
ncbi:MAG: carboxyl transferase domain-containing protein [Desulfarculaceae bacterium]|jgi:acetyl-CoA carboxylase carboxyltransferase component